ncbi:hypothetical protein OB905_05570 [Halobacteria archaeon AArc-dxtr1]|nr:hypothetical protein [Halobacteria archaeon AArc-dxtr1]
MSTTDRMKDYLASHPRMIGALFALMILLSQASSALAGGAASNPGP